MLSSAANIYNAVYRFFDGQQLPADDTGVFFGFAGMTKAVLIAAIEALQNNSAYLNYTNDSKDNRDFWFNEAYNDLLKSGVSCPRDGAIKWFNWLYVAAKGNPDIKDYFGGKPYTTVQDITTAIVQAATGIKDDVVETVQYGLDTPAAIPDLLIPTKSNFIRWAIIGGVLFYAAKKLKFI